MKVAIAHDYLVNRGGAERVVAAMHRRWPDAPIFTSLFHPEATYGGFAGADVRSSFLQRFSRDAAAFRRFLPLFPRAMASLRIEGFDVVICSSSGFAHHVRPAAPARVLVYCYSPPRFLYDPGYGLEGVAPRWVRPVLGPVRAALRASDGRAARRADRYLAVSAVARDRIEQVYGLRAEVLHPPVTLGAPPAAGEPEDQWLVVGRLLPYRRVDLAVRAFSRAGRRLVVVGDGPARAALHAVAGPTVRFAGAVSDAELTGLYAGSRGVVVPGREDFGLVPLEANASGRPAVAFGDGGALDTVRDGKTGVLFAEQTPDAIMAAVARAESIDFDRELLAAHAARFGEDAFFERLTAVAREVIAG